MLHPEIIDRLQKKPPRHSRELLSQFFFLLFDDLREPLTHSGDALELFIESGVSPRKERAAARIHTLPLEVQNIVVREHVFARIKI